MSKRLYEHFNKEQDFSNIDYIVVGSGIGGLTTAIFLAKAGKRVVILERHYIPGGFLHTFRRKKGLEWDVGVHYVGEIGQGKPLRMFSNYLTNNELDWASVGDIYDKAYFGDDEYIFTSGKENQKEQLYRYFPEEKQAIDDYFELIKKAQQCASIFLSKKSLPAPLKFLVSIFFKRYFRRYLSLNTYDTLSKITRNEKLKSVLCAQCGDYGLTPKKSSFAAHAMVINHFFGGAYYPVGGADKIYKSMVKELYRLGGKVYVKADVSEIVVKNNRVEGIKIEDTFIPCRNVISNAGANNTYKHLLKNTPSKAAEEVSCVKPSHSHICLYIGLDQGAEQLNLPKNNVWFYKNYDIDSMLDKTLENVTSDIHFAYISFPSAKDPSWNDKHANTATIQAMTVSNISQFDKFKDDPWLQRGAEYQGIKEEFTKKMLAKVYSLFPQLEGHVIYTEVSTPLSTKHFMNYESGEIYGLEHSPARFELDCLIPKTNIRGLYLTGQDITLVGIAGAMLSGVLTATTILKWNIWKNFKDMSSNYNQQE